INQARFQWMVVPVFFTTLSVFAFLISTVSTYFHPPHNYLAQVTKTAEDDTKNTLHIWRVPKDGKEVYMEQEEKEEGKPLSKFESSESQSDYIRRLFPKILGTILILTVAFSVNHTFYKVFNENIVFTGDWGFLICILLLLLSLNKSLVQHITGWLGRYKWMRSVPFAIFIISLIGIVVLGAFNQGGTETDTKRLFYALVLLAIFFLMITTSYNKQILKFKNRYGARLIILMVLFIFLSYVLLLFYPQGIKLITPLSIILICIIGIYSMFLVIAILGIKWNLPLLGLVLIFSVILATCTANMEDFTHYDATFTKDITNTPADRLNLDSYIQQWILDRKQDMIHQKPGKKFTIVFVSAEGGGSRAGLWSFLVQSYLFDQNPNYFEKHLFSMSGASGGGGGNNMFYTQAYELLENKAAIPLKYKNLEDGFSYRASTIYQQDYLSSSVASLLGRDTFKSITNLFTFRDRGALLENEWETQFNVAFNRQDNPLGQAYLNMMPQTDKYKYIRPLLITNTTEMRSGERVVISTVDISEDTHNMGVFKDLIKAYPNKKRMIKRSTAMSMNARFPYLSPVARIRELGQFGDAGYYNNIGGDVTRRLEKALLKVITKDSSLIGKYEIKHLLISNYEGDTKLSYSSQLIAPALMIANATFAHPEESEKTLTNVLNIQSKRTDIPQETKNIFSLIGSETNDVE
ncbi:MAG: hypothetical protein KAJ23_17025, partial [Maribacter sp.]|nr:hypothetical protein [Maribacter sp.]